MRDCFDCELGRCCAGGAAQMRNCSAGSYAEGSSNPLCPSWAESGECIRNPQYMWSVCAGACSALSYIDADESCAGWAEVGECLSEERGAAPPVQPGANAGRDVEGAGAPGRV